MIGISLFHDTTTCLSCLLWMNSVLNRSPLMYSKHNEINASQDEMMQSCYLICASLAVVEQYKQDIQEIMLYVTKQSPGIVFSQVVACLN